MYYCQLRLLTKPSHNHLVPMHGCIIYWLRRFDQSRFLFSRLKSRLQRGEQQYMYGVVDIFIGKLDLNFIQKTSVIL